MTVAKMRYILQRAIEKLDRYDEDDEVKMVSNTYFLGNCSYFMGVSAEGYVNLNKLEIEDERF